MLIGVFVVLCKLVVDTRALGLRRVYIRGDAGAIQGRDGGEAMRGIGFDQ